MKIRIQKVSGSVLLVMLLITVVILGLFFFGGETPVSQRLVADTSMSEPAQTDALIYWMYILLAVTVFITIAGAIFQFGSKLVDSPKTAIVLLLVVTYSVGSDVPLVIPGYEGTENVPFWLKITDMFLYSTYIMMGVLILLIVGFGISKKLK